MRAERLRAHMNRHTLPIAWIAQEEEGAIGMAALRVHDLYGRDDLNPWLGGVYVRPEFRRRKGSPTGFSAVNPGGARACPAELPAA